MQRRDVLASFAAWVLSPFAGLANRRMPRKCDGRLISVEPLPATPDRVGFSLALDREYVESMLHNPALLEVVGTFSNLGISEAVEREFGVDLLSREANDRDTDSECLNIIIRLNRCIVADWNANRTALQVNPDIQAVVSDLAREAIIEACEKRYGVKISLPTA